MSSPEVSRREPVETRRADHGGTWLAVVKAVALGAVVAAVVNLIVAAVAHALGASAQFRPLTPQVFVPLTVIGTGFGALGWLVVRGHSRRPGHALRWLVPSVVVVSFVPDLLVLGSGTMPGTSTGAVLALMLMHVAVTAAAVPAYRRFLPVER